ncbi:transketolase family protein [Candidatus Woesearchaeota archaeon]|nr:transketolase family protein [Candidatus Woesearchaeota archaeon]
MKLESTRDGFGKGLLKAGQNKKVVSVNADLSESCKTITFKEKYPDRFVEVGVAEQNLMGVAAGLSLAGFIPFASSFACFSPSRSWDQLRISVCYSNLNVKIAGSHGGLITGKDGASHQALEDIAITRCLPNMTVVVPADSLEAEKAVLESIKIKGPVYIRVSRDKTPVLTKENSIFEIGKANTIKKGNDASIIACGDMVHIALEAAKLLKNQGIDARVINCHTIKPIDKKAIIKAAKETGHIVTAEDHQSIGGLGSAVAEVVAENCPVPMQIIGVNDKFGESGEPKELLNKYGLSANHIAKAVIKLRKHRR